LNVRGKESVTEAREGKEAQGVRRRVHVVRSFPHESSKRRDQGKRSII